MTQQNKQNKQQIPENYDYANESYRDYVKRRYGPGEFIG